MHRLIALTSCLLLVPALGHASPAKPKLGIFNVSVVGLDKSLQQTAIDALASAAAGVERIVGGSLSKVDQALVVSLQLVRDGPLGKVSEVLGSAMADDVASGRSGRTAAPVVALSLQ
jgi:hypothetical protein